MNIFDSLFVVRLIFILGIVNFVTGLLVLASCRCIPQIFGRLMKYPAYQRFFKYHCYIWWAFWASVIVHASLAIGITGVSL